MDLSNALSGLKGPGSSAEKKEALKAQVSNEIAMQNAQTLISNATNKCYKAVSITSAEFTNLRLASYNREEKIGI